MKIEMRRCGGEGPLDSYGVPIGARLALVECPEGADYTYVRVFTGNPRTPSQPFGQLGLACFIDEAGQADAYLEWLELAGVEIRR